MRLWHYYFVSNLTLILQMTKLRKEFSVAYNDKVASTYRFPGAELVLFTCSHQPMLSKIRKFSSKIDSGLFTKITSSPPKYVGVCSSNSLAKRRGTRNLIYILPLFFLTYSSLTCPYLLVQVS